jgi:hypothetical protein
LLEVRIGQDRAVLPQKPDKAGAKTMKIQIIKRVEDGPQASEIEVETPVLPHVGDYLLSPRDGFEGKVDEILFSWDMDGILTVEVQLK